MVYRSIVAETEAAKIGVLEPKADDRHQCGIFSSIAWHSFSGGSCRRVARLAGSFGRYANPARSAHPDWRRDARNHKPHQRSRTMTTIQINTSTKCPPWAGYVHPSFVVVKVGNQFVTVQQVKK